MASAAELETLLRKIVNRASNTRKAGSTAVMISDVPTGLLREAAALLGMGNDFNEAKR